MSKRAVSSFAWSVWLITLAIVVSMEVPAYLNAPSTLLGSLFYALVLFAFATVGALISSRRPENPIGWLLGSGTLLSSLGGLALEYAVYTLLTMPHRLPGGEWMLWFGSWVRSPGFQFLIIFVPLLFPNGRLPSLRWRPVAWFAIGEVVLVAVVTMFAPTNESELRLPSLPNPLGVTMPPEIFGPLEGISFLGQGVVALVVVASLVLRFHRAQGDERQQLKWFAYAGLLAVGVFTLILFGAILLPPDLMAEIGSTLFSLLLAGFPIAVGIAIFKYRLYDIDIIIRRTLFYTVPTALLALVYFGSVVVLEQILQAITGVQQSEIATIISTLAIAALFNPLRDRVQETIDRRFYRRKYDAQQVLARFAHIARDEVELEKLSGELLNVVQDTMQPAITSLWLREPEREVK